MSILCLSKTTVNSEIDELARVPPPQQQDVLPGPIPKTGALVCGQAGREEGSGHRENFCGSEQGLNEAPPVSINGKHEAL